MRDRLLKIMIAGLLGTLLLILPATGQQPDNKDGDRKEKTGASTGGGPAGSVLSFYKNRISSFDGNRCPMYPTCSAYSGQAFKKHGFFLGWIMTCDRLMRCGRDELSLAPRIIVDGRIRCHDPLEANDFWWTE